MNRLIGKHMSLADVAFPMVALLSMAFWDDSRAATPILMMWLAWNALVIKARVSEMQEWLNSQIDEGTDSGV